MITYKYLHNGTFLTEDELHTSGILLTETTPIKTKVIGSSIAMRYDGSHDNRKFRLELWAENASGERHFLDVRFRRKDILEGHDFSNFVTGWGGSNVWAYNAPFSYINDVLVEWITIVPRQQFDFGFGEITNTGYIVYLDNVPYTNIDFDIKPTLPLEKTISMNYGDKTTTLDVNGVADAMVVVDKYGEVGGVEKAEEGVKYPLFDYNGDEIQYDNGKEYSILAIYQRDDIIETDNEYWLENDYGQLALYINALSEPFAFTHILYTDGEREFKYYASLDDCEEEWSTTETFVFHLNRRYLDSGNGVYVYSRFFGTQEQTAVPGQFNEYCMKFDNDKHYEILDRGRYSTTTGNTTWGLSTDGLQIGLDDEGYMLLYPDTASSTSAGNSYVIRVKVYN